MKIIRQYPNEIMKEAMPWDIDTKDNWTFISTDDGLLQFDGSYPELFQFNNRRPVRSVFIDNDNNRIYAGGISEFGYFEPSPFSSLRYVCLSDSVGDDRHIGNIWGIYSQNGKVIAQGDNSILIYDTAVNSHNVINTPYKLDGSNLIDGVLWLATDDGLKLLLGGEVVDAPGADPLKGKRIRKLLQSDSALLIVTSDGLWSYKNQSVSRDTNLDELFSDLKEVFSADIKDNSLALGSVAQGLGVVDMATGEFEIYDETSGLLSNTVIALKFDQKGDLWTGMQFGISKILLNDPVESIESFTFPIGSGYVLAHKGNNIYMGTNRGLFRSQYNDSDQKIEKQIERVDDLRGQVWGLSLIDGQLFACLDRGLFIVDDNYKAHRIGEITGVWDIRKVLSSQDRAYVGTYSGIHSLRKKNGEWGYEAPIAGYESSIYNFVQERPDIIWNENAEEGVDRIVIDTLNNHTLEVTNFKFTNDNYPLTADVFLCRIDNGVYFATDNGLYVYDPVANDIVKEKEISNLLKNPVSVKRLKKVNGSLFALTDNELIEADPAGILDVKRYSLSSSVTRPMHEGDVFFPIGSELLAYPTRKGFLIFDFSGKGAGLWKDDFPSVQIKRMSVTNMGDSVVFRGNFGDLKIEPKLSYKENSLRLDFGSYEDIEKGILYSTRINKENWSVPSMSLSKELTDLREGKYVFEVKAISPEGEEAVDSLIFRIMPPWWRNKWMLCLYAIVFIFIILILLRLVQVRASRKHSRIMLEKDQELERQREIHKRESEDKDRHIEQLEREKLDKEIKHKAQEVANMMMTLTQKNDILMSVRRELQNVLSLIPRSNMEARKAISGLQEKVVVDIKSESTLKRVEEELDIVHDNFVKKIRERFPALTNNEIMLCAYIKMNLSTKEIAPLLNISQRGVETMRYRMRKKLGLEREDSLSSFILNFR